ncbi:hypothetical protein [Streptosporangium roseum]|uniref:hypothetical protein n=1 Tax=Streptosporangium roseum TaxID=2001 RepID=UPI0004CC90B7|nr:hypothetical protein [Streptosporangium roseum]
MPYARHVTAERMAAEKAVWALRCTKAVPQSRAALTRLAAYEGLPAETREQIAYEPRSCPSRR